MEYYTIVEDLVAERDRLKEENTKLWRIICALQDYSDYLESTSLSTDDQPRPEGWGCITV